MSRGPNSRRYFFYVAVILYALTQAGCNLLPETKAVRVFMLPADAGVSAAPEIRPVALSLRVRSLQANQMLSGNRIVVLRDANEVSVYGGVRWSDPAPVLIRDRLLEAFASSNALEAVFNEENRLQSDVELSGILRAFHSEYSAGRVRVWIQADLRITDPAGRKLLAHRRFTASEESPGESIEQVVASFGRAGDNLSQQVLGWALREIATSASPLPGNQGGHQ